MKEIINNYKFEAQKLKEYIERLESVLEAERDVNIINDLRERIWLLRMERFEILRDIEDMKRSSKLE